MAMVEMAFVLPVLLLLVFAICEFGLMFSRWLTLSNAVREGARLAVVYRPPASCSEDGVRSEVQQRVASYANAGGVGIEPGDVYVGKDDDDNGGPCTGSSQPTLVRASFEHQFQVLPGIALLAPSITLQYESAMRNE